MIKWFFKFVTGEFFRLSFTGGGGGQQQQPQQPTNQTVQQTNLPAWAQPYSEELLGKAQALTDVNTNPYQTYTGQRLADFTPMQQQAFSNIGNMGVSQQTGQATGLAGLAGLGSLGAGANYMGMATNPAAIQAFMSPYQQNVTDWQKQQAIMDYGRALPGMGAQAAQAGAFGGSRQALQQSEAQRNLQNQLAGIQAQGSQAAFNAAQQAQQFGAGLGLQGYGQAGQLASTLGQLGQQQYGQQMGINAAQQQAGAQQQAMQQQALTNAYQDFLNRQNYPYQQLSFMSDILHGTPTGGITTRQEYQAAPSMFSQIAGLGLGAYGLGKSGLFGKEGGSVPGGLKSYKTGGEVKGYADGGIAQLAGMDVNMADPTTELGVKSQLAKAQGGQQPAVPIQTLLALQQGLQQLHTPMAQPQQTTVAEDLARQVLAQSRPQNVDQGLGSLPAPNLDQEETFSAANGGIVAFAGEGPSQLVGDVDAYTKWRRDNPFIPETEAQVLARRTELEDKLGAGIDVLGAGLGKAYRSIVNPLSAMGRAMYAVPAAGLRTLGFNAPSPYESEGVMVPKSEPATTAIPTPQMSPRRDTVAQFTQQTPAPKVKPRAVAAAPAVAKPTTAVAPTESDISEEEKSLLTRARTLTEKPQIDIGAARKVFEARMEEVAPSQAKDIREFYKTEGERLRSEGDKDRWLALAMGGFAVAAGKSPYAMQNFGEGLGLAAKEISAVNKEMRAAEAARNKAERAEIQADRAEQLGKLKAAQSFEDQQRQAEEIARGHDITATNVLLDHLKGVRQIKSQENIHALDRATREKIANMEVGARNKANALINEYHARVLKGDEAGAKALLPSIQALSEAVGKGAAQQRALTAQQTLQLNAAKASVKSLDDQILFEKDSKRKQTLIGQRDAAMRVISNLESGGETGGGVSGPVLDFSKLPK